MTTAMEFTMKIEIAFDFDYKDKHYDYKSKDYNYEAKIFD